MIPRLHKRGASFKGVCKYILHDASKETADRVLWTATANLVSDSERAWFEMYATARDQQLLKQQAGRDKRGRKNEKPVLHYTLSWAVTDKPTPEHMRETALASLKAMKLEEHQALMSAHQDKEHLHVHIVVNTVHPVTGMTAPLKYTKEAMQDWAREYEQKHGIHCEQRILNHEQRQRDRDANGLRPESAKEAPRKSLNRRRHFAKADIVQRMKRYRAEAAHKNLVERDVTWARQREEYGQLVSITKEAANVAQNHVEANYKRRWRDLYAAQRNEMRTLETLRDNIFERAVFVFVNSERLGNGKGLTLRSKISMICSQAKLSKAVSRLHSRERTGLAQAEKADTAEFLERVWRHHQPRFEAMKSSHVAERYDQRMAQRERSNDPTLFLRARNELTLEHKHGRPTRTAAGAPCMENDDQYIARIRAEIDAFYSRSRFSKPRQASAIPILHPQPHAPNKEPNTMATFNAVSGSKPRIKTAAEIKAEIEDWRRRHPGRDFGREM